MISKIWKNYFKKKSERFKNQLNKNNLYIFPNSKGFQLGALVFFCFTLSIFYQNNFALLLSIIIFFIFFLSIIISYQNLNNLKFISTENLYPSENLVNLNYLISSDQKKERLNLNFSVNKKSINTDIFIDKKISFLHTFKKRGVYEVPKLSIKSTFPFGIINTFGKISFQEKIYVFPNPIKPPKDIFEKLYDKKKDEGFDYEFDKIEEKRDIQNLSRISWKHYTIKKKFYSKEFKFVKNNKNIIIDLEKLNYNDFEKSLSYASYLIDYFYKKKNPFALKFKNFQSSFSCSFSHKKDLLTYLANV